jgi:hypothetical protein
MADTPSWLTNDAIERTKALGQEMQTFLMRRDEARDLDPKAEVEPHSRLLELLAALKTERRDGAPDVAKEPER